MKIEMDSQYTYLFEGELCQTLGNLKKLLLLLVWQLNVCCSPPVHRIVVVVSFCCRGGSPVGVVLSR